MIKENKYEYRCFFCNRVLMVVTLAEYMQFNEGFKIEIKCKRCKKCNKIDQSKLLGLIA